jgi:hypothetical protein
MVSRTDRGVVDAPRFDRFAKQVSRRGLAAVLGGGLLVGHASAIAQGDRGCGGRLTRLTRFCRTAPLTDIHRQAYSCRVGVIYLMCAGVLPPRANDTKECK